MKKGFLEPGSLIGGMLLIAGCCIGAGMLAIPILTGLVGFFPACLIFLLVWAFMTSTALLLLEVNGWFYKRVNIITMAGEVFGKTGKILTWLLYLFLFYSILVAYMAGSGKISAFALFDLFSWEISPFLCGLVFALLMGGVVYFGTKRVDWINRFLMIGLIAAYLMLVFLGVGKVSPSLLLHIDMEYALLPLSIMIVSFGFHNMIPTLTTYLKGDLKRMRQVIIGGSLIALCIYILWELVVLGVIPVTGQAGILHGYVEKKEAAEVLKRYFGSSLFGSFVQMFAFFAIITSFLAQTLSLMHFIADGLKVEPTKKRRGYLLLLTLLPPILFAYFNPTAFFAALDFAGGICAVLLFGILPAAMAWMGRYRKKMTSAYHLPGGKISLCAIIAFALFVLFHQVFVLFS